MKFLKIQYVLYVMLGLALFTAGKLAYNNYKIRAITSKLNQELTEAKLEIGRAKTEFGNAEKYIKTLEEKVQQEIKARKAAITRIGWFKGRLKIARKNLKSKKGNTEYIDKPIIIKGKPLYKTGMIYQALSPRKLVPVRRVDRYFADHRLQAQVSILPKPNLGLDIPTSLQYQLTLSFRGELAETLLPSGGRNFYLNIFETFQGKDLGKVELSELKVIVKDERKPHFMWTPHLDVGVLPFFRLKAKELRAGGSVGISLFGFGLTKNDLSWRFLRLSTDIQESIGAGLSPVVVNLGQALPLVSNIWLSPHFSYFINRGSSLGLFLGGVL